MAARRNWIWLIALTAPLCGCTREAFRNRADKDVEAVISQKNVIPQYEVKNWHVYPDARARFADPNCPDYPSYPPDDYAARMLSPNPQRPGRGGAGRYEGDGYLKQIAQWDATNRTDDAQTQPAEQAAPPVLPNNDPANEAYLNALRTNQQPYRIRLDQAVELAIYNSREFQDRREDLYLAALPVTLERFTFSAQAFAAETAILELGGQATANPGNRWRINTEAGISRRFSTGAELIVRLANQVVIELGGGQPQISVGTIGLALTIPFLRGGGFAVTLEPLTQAERTLLYAIRSYARFRGIFYTAIAGQGDYTNNPYGLQGLSANLGRGIGANLTANQIGYLPTILRSAILLNERNNVVSFESYQRLFKNLEEGGNVTKLLVGRIEQQLLQGRATVLQRQQEYIDNIDNFKLQLGVPATVPLELDETPLKPIREQLRRIEDVYLQLTALENQANKFEVSDGVQGLRARWNNLFTDSELTRGTEAAAAQKKFGEEWGNQPMAALAKRIKELAEARRTLQNLREQKLRESQAVDTVGKDLDTLELEYDRLRFEEALRRYESRPWLKEQDPKRRELEQLAEFRQVNGLGVLVTIQARNEKLVKYRGDWVDLPAIVLDDVDVLKIPLDDAYQKVGVAALNNRFDLMNARAQVVDAWRQVSIRANSLRGIFDVEYDLSTNSPVGGSNPAQLGGSRTLQQLRLRWEPPFVRRAERNLYRASLISYQRQRRNLMAFEDNIVTDVRTELRLLRQLQQTFQVQQRAVELAYLQVDNARGTLVAPPDPRLDGAAAAVAQTEQLLQVQAALVRAQNDLYSTWVRYLNARLNLLIDLELLSLDARGLWTDDQPRATSAYPAAAPGPAAAALPDAAVGGGAAAIVGGPNPELLPKPEPVARIRPGLDAAQPDLDIPLAGLPDPDALRAVVRDPFPVIELPVIPITGGGGGRAPEIPGIPTVLPPLPGLGK